MSGFWALNYYDLNSCLRPWIKGLSLISFKFHEESGLSRDSGSGISGWQAGLGFGVAALAGCAVVAHIIGFAFTLAFELVFFFAFFCQLLLALFIGVIGSCHCMLS